MLEKDGLVFKVMVLDQPMQRSDGVKKGVRTILIERGFGSIYEDCWS